MKKTLKIFVSAIFIIMMTAVMAFAADNSVYTVSDGVEFVDQWNKAAQSILTTVTQRLQAAEFIKTRLSKGLQF